MVAAAAAAAMTAQGLDESGGPRRKTAPKAIDQFAHTHVRLNNSLFRYAVVLRSRPTRTLRLLDVRVYARQWWETKFRDAKSPPGGREGRRSRNKCGGFVGGRGRREVKTREEEKYRHGGSYRTILNLTRAL